MARLRTIKPSFFTNENLVELPPLVRLLFAGLWTIADRDGRLEDRPKKIKLQILPADECDVDAMLEDLSTAGFIVRYQVDGGGYIAMPTWHKHQNPHIKEAPSTIPAPPQTGTSTVLAPDKHSAGTNLGSGEPGGVLSLGSCSLSSVEPSVSATDDGKGDAPPKRARRPVENPTKRTKKTNPPPPRPEPPPSPQRTPRELWGFIYDRCRQIADPADPNEWRPVFADEIVRVQTAAAKADDQGAYLRHCRANPSDYAPSQHNIDVLQRLKRTAQGGGRRSDPESTPARFSVQVPAP